MPTLHLLIPDLSCGHCVRSVTEAAQALDPQARVQADPSTKHVDIETTADPAALRAALTAAGYPPQA